MGSTFVCSIKRKSNFNHDIKSATWGMKTCLIWRFFRSNFINSKTTTTCMKWYQLLYSKINTIRVVINSDNCSSYFNICSISLNKRDKLVIYKCGPNRLRDHQVQLYIIKALWWKFINIYVYIFRIIRTPNCNLYKNPSLVSK